MPEHAAAGWVDTARNKYADLLRVADAWDPSRGIATTVRLVELAETVPHLADQLDATLVQLRQAERVAEVAYDELVGLWADLHAVAWDSPAWTPRCEQIAGRIARLTAAIGPASWKDVPPRIVRSGLYNSVHRNHGLPDAPVDWDTFAEHEARVEPSPV